MCLFGFFGGFVSVNDTGIVFRWRPAQDTIDEIQANNNSKPAKSPADLVQQLKQRGLVFADGARAERYIDNIGYYRLSAYMYPFLAEPKTAHQYKTGITFDRVLRLYRFDKKLRVLLFNEIEKIEVAFRDAVVNTITDSTGDIFFCLS